MRDTFRSIYAEIAVVVPIGSNTHQELNFGELLEPKLRKLLYESYDEIPEQFSQVFNVQTSKKAKETDYGMGAMSPWVEFGSSTTPVAGATALPVIPYAVISPAQERTYTHKEFAQGFIVERKFADDEMYHVIEKMPKDLARAGRYKVEGDAASLFNTAGTANIYDGVPLLSDVHPLVMGAIQAPGKTSTGAALGIGKTSNLMIGGVSDAKIKEAMIKMRSQVDEAGKLIQFKADTIVCSPYNEFLVREILQSAQKSGTTDNDINSIQGRLKIVVLDFLTADVPWFVLDSKRNQINFFWRVKPEFNRTIDYDSLASKYAGYMRYSFGVSDFRGIVGSMG